MDGPTVNHTVADVFQSDPHSAMTYHVMSAGYSAFTPLGTIVGAALYGMRYRPLQSPLAMMGTCGFLAGVVGMLVGLGGKIAVSKKNDPAKLPWDEDGIQQRVNGLSHNFKVRVIDLSVWSGICIAGGTLLLAGGPRKFHLSPGIVGVVQAVSLGSALGSMGAIGCIYSTTPKEEKYE